MMARKEVTTLKKAYSEPELNPIGAFGEDTKSLQSGDVAGKVLWLGEESSELTAEGPS